MQNESRQRSARRSRDTTRYIRRGATGDPPAVEEPVFPGPSPTPTQDEIAARAYELYLGRGEGDGQDLDDWFTAERELTERGR
jgi:hypothetical protein